MEIKWSDDLATGIYEVDAQHKEIFRRIGVLYNACREGHGKDKVGEVIAFLAEYVVKHFKAEEALQKSSGYPHYNEHKQMHEAFLQDFTKLKADFAEKGASPSMVLATNRVVVNWLIDHIQKVDKKIAVHINESKKQKIAS